MSCMVCGNPTKLFFKSEKDICITSNSNIRNEGVCIYKCTSCQHMQKQVDEKYLNEITSIYKNYNNLYSISDGREQVKFLNDDLPQSRSSIITDNIKSKLPSSGKLLDIGSGNGAFLKAFSGAFKNWDLYAQDLHDNQKEEIFKVPNIKDFFALPLAEIQVKFDFISLIHSFEHMNQPVQILKDVKTLLKKDGLLLIQVPNIDKNIFDGLIYDHISHFTPATLARTIETIFDQTFFPDKQVIREITLLAKLAGTSPIFPHKPMKKEDSSSADLKNLNKLIRDVDRINRPTAVFGTAYVGTFMGSLLGENLAFFVDEDENRNGKTLLSKKVYHPREITGETDILLPFDRNQASQICARWKNLNFTPLAI